MKAIVSSTLLLITLLCSLNTSAQVPDSVYYERLFYTCKAWGHVKYYHTETANGNVNWDDELLNVIDAIKNAPDNDAFNQTLLALLNSAGEMGTIPGTLPTVPDSLNNNTDYSWIQTSLFSESGC